MAPPRRPARFEAAAAPDMTDFLTALALVLVIEGLFLAIFPQRLRQIVEMLAEMPPDSLRIGGIVAASLGVFLVWLLRG